MLRKVRDYITRNNLINENDHILVGLSGGADSVCLLFLLHQLKETTPFTISAIHINHLIRENAIFDQNFVESVCEKLQVPITIKQIDVQNIAKEKKISIEEAGRIARYEAFCEEANRLEKESRSSIKIAVAHHENDQVETVLFHLFRGSSLKGLRGIKPKTEYKAITIIRPLLNVTRNEIVTYLAENQIDYVTDESNLSNEYTRNRIRNQILPQIEETVFRGSGKNIASAAMELQEVEDYILSNLGEKFRYYNQRFYDKEKNRFTIPKEEFLKEHILVQKRYIYSALEKLANDNKDITKNHVEQLVGLFSKEVGKQIDLPYSIIAKSDYESVHIYLWQAIIESIKKTEEPHLEYKVFSYKKTMKLPYNEYTKWFDYDKIKKSLVLRTRESGDYFYCSKEHKQTVKAYMINEKIPKEQREEIPMVMEDNHMLWMIGYRISDFYKVDENTKNILELTYTGGKT